MVPDLSVPRRVHVVAVGGAAMSAIAHILAMSGHTVSGSDQVDSPILDRLRADGCTIWVGHDAAHVAGADLVAISTAVKPGNPELDAAAAAGIPVASRPDMMDALGRMRRTLAVSGTHGKTTTSAMAALVLVDAGWDPSFIVGGQVNQLGTGVRWRPTEWLAVEADESDGSFLRFGAEAVIVANIEADHLDFHGTMTDLEAAFDRFVEQAIGPRVVCLDDAGTAALAARVRVPVTTYGLAATADYRITDHVDERLGSSFAVLTPVGERVAVRLQLPGLHVVRNATAVLAMATQLGIDPAVTVASLARFTGTGRRFERRGTVNGVDFVDDYAHLPTEVAANVVAAANAGWTRVVAVFQPHRYTRVRDVGADFATSFDGADVVVITGLYPAGQEPIPGISGRTVFDAIRTARPELDLHYAESRPELVALLGTLLCSGDLCLTMNAGDLTTLPDEMRTSDWAASGVASRTTDRTDHDGQP